MFHVTRQISFAAALALFTHAQAATFCVTTTPGLQTALTAAQANGQDDYIYVAAGHYALTAGLTFVSTEAHSIELVGGADPSCQQLHAGETIIDGQHNVRPLYAANTNGAISIQQLTFLSGNSGSGAGGGVVAVSQVGTVIFVQNKFAGNRSTDIAGALYAASDSGQVVVYDNLVFANRGGQVGGVVMMQASGEGFATNNTIVGNTSDAPAVPAGLFMAGAAHFKISNNIVWNNAAAGGSDFGTQSAHSRQSNDIGIVAAGATPDILTGEQSTDPQFVSCGFLCFGFELPRSSPLVDAGSDSATHEMGSNLTDLAQLPRFIGPHVDIGAYENEALFQDGFDP